MLKSSSEALKDILKKEIQKNGPISVARYMESALGHPKHGYYMNRDPFGDKGDFTTAPEISQIFGEMIGLWFVDIWNQMGSPDKFVLLECGPGRGTMMVDMLRAAKASPEFLSAAQIYLLETSPVLKAKQQEALNDYNVQWFNRLPEIEAKIPVFFIANEFFDALPIWQYEFRNGHWNERVIGVNQDEDFYWSIQNIDFDPTEGLNLHDPKEGQILELSKARRQFMRSLSELIKSNTGAGLVIDYGHLRHGYGNTFQALKSHNYTDPLLHTGDADLTAHVDFKILKEEAEICVLEVFGKVTQGEFLKGLGVQIHASRLIEKADKKQAQDIQSALHRLTHSDGMGSLFKVLGVGYGTSVKAAGF